MEKVKRSLNFDLKQERLSLYYGKSSTQAYHEIEKCLKETLDFSFSRRQSSGYVSMDDLTFADIYVAVGEIQERLPWFRKCVSSIDVTSVGKVYDLTAFEAVSVEQVATSEQGLPNKRRAFYFDLNTDALKKYFSATSPNNAYKKIESVMSAHGFQHRQGSGYLSYRPLSLSQALYIFEQMKKEMPWLMKCATKMDLTEAERVFDLKPFFDRNALVNEIAQNGISEIKVHEQSNIGSIVSFFDIGTGLEGELFVKDSDFVNTVYSGEERIINGALEILAEVYPAHEFSVTSVISDPNVSLAYELADVINEYGNEGLSKTELFMDLVPSCYEKVLTGNVSSQIAFVNDLLQNNQHRQDDPDFGVEGRLPKLLKRLEEAEKEGSGKKKKQKRSDKPVSREENKEKKNKREER